MMFIYLGCFVGTNKHMWDMSRFVMIALLSLHSDKMLYLGAYKILVT